MVVPNLTVNASEYFGLSNGQTLPQITATVKDLGTFEALYFSFLIFVACVVVHELAHWIVLLKHNPDAVITIKRRGIGLVLQTGVEEDYAKLTKENKLTLYFVGIFAGLLPIGLASVVHPLYWLVLPAYFVGTYRDWELVFIELRK